MRIGYPCINRTIDLEDFRSFIEESKPFDFDVMQAIKDKEVSVRKALEILGGDPRFV